MALQLDAKKALIFRITHIKNVPWIARFGLHCSNSEIQDEDFVPIGNQEIIERRSTRHVPIHPGGALSDYIPFYFTPFSIMMYNIRTGYGDIRQIPNSDLVILASSLRVLADNNVTAIFADRHAYLNTAKFFSSLDDLDNIDWEILRRRDFRRDLNDPGKTERYQAEALIHKHLPVELLTGIICCRDEIVEALLESPEMAGVNLRIVSRPGWYFT